MHDVNILDQILPEPGAFYVMDRGYIDFEGLYVFTLSAAFFVVRTKENLLLERRYSRPVDKSTGVRSDQTVILIAIESAKAYPETLRRVSFYDAETDKRLKFLTNNFVLPALTIAQIYKARWQVELFLGRGESGFSGDDGPATAARLNGPLSPRFDAAGNLYFSDSATFRIRKIDNSGIITTLAGTGLWTDGSIGASGPAGSAQVLPATLALNAVGNVSASR